MSYRTKDILHEKHERAQAIIMLDANTEHITIALLTGYEREYTFKLRKKFLQHGIIAIEDKQKKNPKELLTRRQREELLHTVRTKTPKRVQQVLQQRLLDSEYFSRIY